VNDTNDTPPADELDELLERRKQRDADRAAKSRALKIEYLKLEERFESELGSRGSMFEIIDLSAVEPSSPFIVVKLGEAALHKKFEAAAVKAKKGEPADVMAIAAFVTPCVVHPDGSAFLALCARRPALWGRVLVEVSKLYGTQFEEDEKK
jgi:hypothetical protein